ncbi:hypothetical protein HPB48_007636 [Haemaphysalis longicornis]|uniref:DDE-1 domain-containing protein n=1 Tax=Haemaphysalis longicornis TaxID=44386 RepID=A0A9J6G314_HAELO|nr:hypothetical protein HPB48_007636 [Haemaphysalis longicornis]
MDNCSANQTTCELDNIELKFLPPNTTARLQPLDRSTKSFKLGYRRRLLDRLLMNLRVGTELKVDQLGAIHMMTGAWNSVKQSVANCFRKAGFVTAEFRKLAKTATTTNRAWTTRFASCRPFSRLLFQPECLPTLREPLTAMFRLFQAPVTRISLDEGIVDIAYLEELDRRFYELAPNGLPSDIAPFLGLLYRRRERAIEALFREGHEILGRLFSTAEKSYVPDDVCLDGVVHVWSRVKVCSGGAVAGCGAMVAGFKFEMPLWKGAGIVDGPMKPGMRNSRNNFEGTGAGRRCMQTGRKLPFTVAFLLETLRLHPVAPLGLPHNTSTDTEVGKLPIPKDTGIMYNIYGVNRDPKLWDEPEEFRPERFLDPVSGKLRQDIGPLITFGLGPRTCPGQKLAHVDMFYVVVRLLQRINVRAPGKASDVDFRSFGSNIFLLPAKQNIVLTRKH